MKNIIHYGFGKDYLKNWSIKEALREIYQNFLDYGDFYEIVKKRRDKVIVSISNDWKPESLDFLRIGNSKKDGIHTVGKHGEGLKMAFLILSREGLDSKIFTDKYVVYPSYYEDNEIGECFCLKYVEHAILNKQFTITFECDKELFNSFRENIITDKDIIYTHNFYGSIVDKEIGNIYSGGLFVAKVNNLKYAYDIKPEHLPLDRDRSVPRSFDVNWSCSKILESYGKWQAEDTTHSDTEYISTVPEEIKKNFEPIIVGEDIEFVVKTESGETKIVSNANIKNSLKNDGFFANAIKKLKMFLVKKLGLYEMLLEFKKKHVHTQDAINDFDLILDRLENKNKEEYEISH